jgi:hypothetical protein
MLHSYQGKLKLSLVIDDMIDHWKSRNDYGQMILATTLHINLVLTTNIAK